MLHQQIADALAKSWMPNDWFALDARSLRHYQHKADAVAAIQPKTGIEIGTRCGYSLLAFHLASPGTRWLCVDGWLDADSPQCMDHWQRIVAEWRINAQLLRADTRGVTELPPADFAHVDGDHSYAGALADLHLVADVPAILADDCDNASVRRAVEDFCASRNRRATFTDDGLRQSALIL
jgi:cephalosporin hydroxylase